MSGTAEKMHLTAELESALLRQLMVEWRNVNQTYFKGKLVPPVLQLGEAGRQLGCWTRHNRTLELSRQLVLEQPWGVVIEVLKHEVAHQYTHEVLAAFGETAHGPAFRQVCEAMGIDATAAGMPSAAPGEAPAEEVRLLARISRLLALAESDNQHEAEAAMAEAQRLMLKYNLEGRSLPRGAGHYRFRHLGPPKGRFLESERAVAMILSKHFFVETIWARCYMPLLGREGRILEAMGTTANLEMAAYVHDFLHQTAQRLWLAHKKAHRLRSDRDRQSYLAGVMLGFEEKLRQQERRNQEEGLVWTGDADLGRFMRRRYPQVRYTRSKGAERSAAHHHGRAAGRGIVLNRVITTSGGARGPLLLKG